MYSVSMKGLLQGLVLLQGPVLYCIQVNILFWIIYLISAHQHQYRAELR